MDNLQWIFDPAPPSGARQGGLASTHIIKPGLDEFVREVLQNCRDQRVGSDVVDVRFTFYSLEGEWKEEVLECLGWPELEPHIEAASTTGGVTIGPQLESALESIDGGSLLLLRIDDSGTKGLTGPEDDPPDANPGNFNALCRHSLVTSEQGGPRGGSFGIGKSILWRFSALSTVLFSSRIQGSPGPGFRFIGRTELPGHHTEKGIWSGPGWYGARQELGHGQERAVSGWDEAVESVARGVYLDRPAQLGTGTSILVVGFREPEQEETRKPQEVASQVLDSATRWFWPSIHADQPTMRVSARVYDNHSEVYNQNARVIPEVAPFVAINSARPEADQVSEPGDMARRPLAFRVPRRRPVESDDGAPEVESPLELRLRLAGSDDAPERQNQIALMRGAGMVVRYHTVATPWTDRIYHAVLYAGLAHGDTAADEALEGFLRASEPPSHNEWTPWTERLRAEYYPGAQRRLGSLWAELKHQVSDLLEKPQTRSEQGPTKLAELFPISGRGASTPPPKKFRVDMLQAHIEDGVWNLSGRVRRPPRSGADWGFTVRAWLDAETGMGDPMPIGELVVDAGTPQQTGRGWHCRVPGSVREIRFSGRTEGGIEEVTVTDLYRSRLRVDVNPFQEGS